MISGGRSTWLLTSEAGSCCTTGARAEAPPPVLALLRRCLVWRSCIWLCVRLQQIKPAGSVCLWRVGVGHASVQARCEQRSFAARTRGGGTASRLTSTWVGVLSGQAVFLCCKEILNAAVLELALGFCGWRLGKKRQEQAPHQHSCPHTSLFAFGPLLRHTTQRQIT